MRRLLVLAFGSIATTTAAMMQTDEARCSSSGNNSSNSDNEQKSVLYSWGSGQYGQLGLGGEDNVAMPTRVSELGNGGGNVVQAVAGGEHSLVLMDSGDVLTCGRGQDLVLGHGDDANVDLPRVVDALAGKRIVFVDCSDTHCVAIDDAHAVFAWGNRATGLGTDNDESSEPLEVTPLRGKQIVASSCGRNHTLALSSSGTVYSWGSGYAGALGHGVNTSESEPKAIEALSGIAKIAAGNGFSLFLAQDGTLYSSGNCDYGQLGQGSGAQRYIRTPLPVRALRSKRITDIAAGEFHSGKYM
jgi:alpha-tubulin suppressor-like RCC1 family protein